MVKTKAIALNSVWCDSYYHSKKWFFKKGHVYSVKVVPFSSEHSEAIYVNGLPMCDVGSTFFEENFKLIQ